MTREEMDSKLTEIKELKRMKEEIESEISALEKDVIGYIMEHGERTINKSGNASLQFIGMVNRAVYHSQTRETLDRATAKRILSAADYDIIKKVSTYNVLRIS